MKINFNPIKKSFCMLSTLLLSSWIGVFAGNTILLKSGTIRTEADFSNKVDQVPASKEIFNGQYYRLVQFEKVLTENEKVTIELSGIKLLGYIPYNTFFVSIPLNYNLNQLSNYKARTILPIQQKDKLGLLLREGEVPAYAKKGDRVDLVVQYFKNLSATAAREALISEGCEILSNLDATQLITIRVDENKWKEIAALPYVKFLQPIDDVPVPEDTRGRSLHRSNVINSDLPMGRHYDGSGVSIALADDGVVGPHIDFTGRITQYTTDLTGSHGDMTAGIAVGAGNLDPNIKGMASGANIYIYNIANYPHFVNAGVNLQNLGSVITSTSYSQGCNTYDANAQLGDQLMHQLKYVLPVFSGGNNNNNNCGFGAGTQWGNITGGYKQGKNVIAVANLDAFAVIDNSSSHGPAEDGRIKPDISANGKDQLSTAANNTAQTGGGTSAACPGIAGISAQLYQAYRELTGEPNPEAALIKACLLNSADDIGVVGPDYFFGYGRVNALQAVKTIEDTHYLIDSLSDGQQNVHTINVPPGSKRLRVMVLWSDVEGDPTAALALVNDLNLEVSDPNAASFNPWVLNPAPNAATLDDPAIRSIDSLNNMEQVTIENPSPGSYTISINGHSVPFGIQKYHVVYQYDMDEIVVTYPYGGEGFVPGEMELLRWDASSTTGNFQLDYSTDSGLTWNVISSVGSAIRQYNWTVPSNLSSNTFIRVTNGSVSGQNFQPFTIVGVPQNLTVDWACADSLKLVWNAVNGAASYEVSKLGAFYMDSVGTSNTNSIVLHNISLSDTIWLSVKAKLGSYSEGRRAIAIRKLPGLFNCSNALDAALISQNPSNGLAYACLPLANYPVSVLISNLGVPPIGNFDVSYQLNNNPVITETVSNSIAFGNTTTLTFATTIDISGGTSHTLKTWLTYPSDANASNDTLKSIFTTSPVFVAPIAQTFQAAAFPPQNWLRTGTNPIYQWSKSQTITGSSGTSTEAAWFDNYSCNTPGSLDYLTTELVDMSLLTQPELSFDVAYVEFTGYEDELRVEISTDCGLTFVPTGYSKLGAVLASAGQNNTDWAPGVASDWRRDAINLQPFIGSANVLFRFVNVNDYGNNLYIDNVNITDGPLSVQSVNFANSTSLYPNPGQGLFNLQINQIDAKQIKLEVFDALGNLVMQNDNVKGNRGLILDLQDKSNGIYTVKLSSANSIYFHKLVKM
jgi:hypothetical protein